MYVCALEESVPPMPELTKDESLARLARSYFVVMLLLFCKILSGGRGCLLQMHVKLFI